MRITFAFRTLGKASEILYPLTIWQIRSIGVGGLFSEQMPVDGDRVESMSVQMMKENSQHFQALVRTCDLVRGLLFSRHETFPSSFHC